MHIEKRVTYLFVLEINHGIFNLYENYTMLFIFRTLKITTVLLP